MQLNTSLYLSLLSETTINELFVGWFPQKVPHLIQPDTVTFGVGPSICLTNGIFVAVLSGDASDKEIAHFPFKM